MNMKIAAATIFSDDLENAIQEAGKYIVIDSLIGIDSYHTIQHDVF